MSEYQYYEFSVIDNPLSDKDMRSLRNLSSRARITPTSFIIEYNWGDFKGNPFPQSDFYGSIAKGRLRVQLIRPGH